MDDAVKGAELLKTLSKFDDINVSQNSKETLASANRAVKSINKLETALYPAFGKTLDKSLFELSAAASKLGQQFHL